MTQDIANTSVMLLAAGLGKRMHPLTLATPKPLLKVGNLSLIEHHIVRLANMGFKHLVINIAYLGEQIRETLGSGEKYHMHISYSDETADGPLETAGGLAKALPQIMSEHFVCINADIFTDYNFTDLINVNLVKQTQGHLVLVKNPTHNPDGDFSIGKNNLLTERLKQQGFTYSGIAFYHKALFRSVSSDKQGLAPLFHKWLGQKRLSASLYQGQWTDVGTPERLDQLNAELQL